MMLNAARGSRKLPPLFLLGLPTQKERLAAAVYIAEVLHRDAVGTILGTELLSQINALFDGEHLDHVIVREFRDDNPLDCGHFRRIVRGKQDHGVDRSCRIIVPRLEFGLRYSAGHVGRNRYG
jgi:hypothetical protein